MFFDFLHLNSFYPLMSDNLMETAAYSTNGMPTAAAFLFRVPNGGSVWIVPSVFTNPSLMPKLWPGGEGYCAVSVLPPSPSTYHSFTCLVVCTDHMATIMERKREKRWLFFHYAVDFSQSPLEHSTLFMATNVWYAMKVLTWVGERRLQGFSSHGWSVFFQQPFAILSVTRSTTRLFMLRGFSLAAASRDCLVSQ